MHELESCTGLESKTRQLERHILITTFEKQAEFSGAGKVTKDAIIHLHLLADPS